MQNYKSSLEFIMDRLDITGKEIAEALGLDESLVSKWKNNTRPLHLRSPHLPNLVAFLLCGDQKNYLRYHFLKKFLEEHNYGQDLSENHNLNAELSAFLTSNAPIFESIENQKIHNEQLNKTGQKASMYIFKGNQGRQVAISDFFNTLFNEALPQEVYIVTQEDISWMIGDERYLRKWIQYISATIEKGHKLTVIYWVDRPIDELGIIFNLYLPLYLKNEIKTFFIPKYTDLYFKCSLYLIKDKVGLWGMEGTNRNDRHTMLFWDTLSLNHYQNIYENFIRSSKNLMSSFTKEEYPAILKEIGTKNISTSNSIFVSKVPTFTTLPEELFYEVINISEIPKSKANLAKSIYQESSLLIQKNNDFLLRMIFCKKELSRLLKKSTFTYKDLSLMIDQEVTVPIEFFRRHLLTLISRFESSSTLKIGLTEKPLDIDLFIQDETFFLGWNFEESDKVLLFYEHNLNRSIYYHYDQIWKSIPSFEKDPYFFREKLEKLMNDE